MKTISQTAVLIFSRTAKAEAVEKPMRFAHEVFTKLQKHTVQAVLKSGFTHYHISEKNQVGNSFGSRLNSAMQDVFSIGHSQIIVIGNDCPMLNASHIIAANKAMLMGKTVLGPSNDGGFYLWGLHKENFKKLRFNDFPWQSSKLYSVLTTSLEQQNIDYCNLPNLQDIDCVFDLSLLLNEKKIEANLRLLFKRVLAEAEKNSPLYISNKNERLHLSIYFNKGSPCFPEL